jgi:hypothetical protein
MRRIIVISGVIVILVGISSIVAINMKPEPPLSEIEKAHVALSAARNANADTYAPEAFNRARMYYDSAMLTWRLENEKFFISRDYSTVIILAGMTEDAASHAALESVKVSGGLASSLSEQLNVLQRLVTEVNILSRFPLSARIRERMAKGKLLLGESQAAYDQGLLLHSQQKIGQAESLLKNAHKDAYSAINNYFENFNTWSSWKVTTIRESKQKKSSAILVDKYAGKCYVYKNGALTHEFDAELGKNWIGDKRQKGDRATPEGLYKIVDKKEGSRTKYHKALLINYPNDDDKKRFSSEVANGSLSSRSKIGGLIEIHGHGGKGADWTDGCVALTNSDMDKIYKLVQIGTPVTIIGSAITLDKLLQEKN